MDKTSAPEFWPGPMEGVARSEFISTANELDLVSRWMTPFLRISDNIPSRGRIDRFLAPFLASGKPVVLQLMGDDPEKLAVCAKIAVEAGAEGVNLNCGCPSRRVVRRHAGGGTLHAPSVVGNIAQKVKNAIGERPFSLKFRAGERDWREMEVFLPEWLATKCVDLLFFHCRTVAEKYDPVPDREARFARAAELAGDVPLILNGDLDGGAETFFLLQKCRARGAMFARNWMRDPFLLRRCEKKAAPDPETGRKEFFRVFCSKNPPRGAKLEIARMLWGAKSPEFREVLTKG